MSNIISPTLKALHDQLDSLKTRASELLGKGASITDADKTEVDTLTKEIPSVQAEIARFVQLEGATNAASEFLNGRPRGIQSVTPLMTVDPNAPIEHGATFGYGVEPNGRKVAHAMEATSDQLLTPEVMKAISTKEYNLAWRKYCVMHGNTAALSPGEQRALYEGSDQAGGFLVPMDLVLQLIQRKPTPNRIASRFSQHTTGRDKLGMPTVEYNPDNDDADIYTSPIRFTPTGERPASSTAHRVTEPTFGSVEVPIYTFMGSIPLTNDLVEDSAFDLNAYVADKFGEAEDMMYEFYGINGTGLKQPEGILRAPGSLNEPASVQMGNPISYAGLTNLYYNLADQYDENAAWVWNKKNTERYLAGLTDNQNRPLWAMGAGDDKIASPKPKEMFGVPTLRCAFMPNPAANAYPIIYGDLSAYHRVRRLAISIQVLKETYAELNMISMLARVRWGGAVLEPWKLKAGVQAAIS